MFFRPVPTTNISPDQALPGRAQPLFSLPERHFVLDAPLVTDEVPAGFESAIFAMGCFWGAEEHYWQQAGVWSTSVGYIGGWTPHPTYEEVCSGMTGHAEATRVVYDPAVVSFADLVEEFYGIHDPTQGMRQANDIGTQYRSAIFTTSKQQAAEATKLTANYQPVLREHGYGEITTEIVPATTYYYAEPVHQQYLAKNPNGYRCHAAVNIPFPR